MNISGHYFRKYFPCYDGNQHRNRTEIFPIAKCNIQHSRFYSKKITMEEVDKALEEGKYVIVLRSNTCNWENGRMFAPVIKWMEASFLPDISDKELAKKSQVLYSYRDDEDPSHYEDIELLHKDPSKIEEFFKRVEEYEKANPVEEFNDWDWY